MPDSTTEIKRPATEAGRGHLDNGYGSAKQRLAAILAIEAEAAAAERAAIRAALVRATKGAADAPFFLGILNAREPSLSIAPAAATGSRS